MSPQERAADRRVAPADATWLMMDEPTNPMMITGILWFGDPVDHDRLIDTLQRRLVDRYPKFASRIVHHGGAPYWEPDPNFDLLAHVHRAALPAPAGRLQMEAFVAQMMSTRLDPDRALWFIHVVENFERGTALVVRIHHVIADGISLARVLLQLAGDEEPAPEHEARSFGDTFRRAYALGTSWLMSTDRWREVARAGADSAAAIARLLALSADPPTPLKQPLGIRKVAAWLSSSTSLVTRSRIAVCPSGSNCSSTSCFLPPTCFSNMPAQKRGGWSLGRRSSCIFAKMR